MDSHDSDSSDSARLPLTPDKHPPRSIPPLSVPDSGLSPLPRPFNHFNVPLQRVYGLLLPLRDVHTHRLPRDREKSDAGPIRLGSHYHSTLYCYRQRR
jgi:hypothetical protein